MWRRTFGILAVLSMPLLADGGKGRVDLPLESYEELRKEAPDVPSATVVESARFSGAFAHGGLTFTVEGRAIGSRPEVPLLSGAEGFELEGCDGTALVRRTEPGTLALLPLAARFRVTCRVAAEPGRERLVFVASPAILHADASVADGRIEQGAEGEAGRAVTLLRTITSRQVLPVSATGRYRITLLPDEVAFRYEIALHNPNRDRTSFALPLGNGERVERTEPSAGDETGGAWRLDAAAGDSTLVVTGRLAGTRFTPPLEASAQMLLVETHPLVKADLEAPARRVSPAEVGIATEYRGGRGFLLRGREPISWRTSVVEALRTGDVVVQRADHSLYLGRDGGLLAETQLAVENQGAPELPLLLPDPLFAAVQGRPVLLMPERGGIRVPLDPGKQLVSVQHRARVATLAGLLAAHLPLAASSAETGFQRVVLSLPGGWLPLYARFGSDRWLPLPGLPFVLWLLVLVLLADRALAALLAPGLSRRALAVAAGAAGMTSPFAFWTVVLAAASIGALRLAARLPEASITFRRALALSILFLGSIGFLAWRAWVDDVRTWAGGAGGLGALSGGVAAPGFFEKFRPVTLASALGAPPAAAARAQARYVQSPRALPDEVPPSSRGASEYRGLPVRREMPEGERSLVLAEPAAARPHLVVLLAAEGWMTALRAGLLALAAALVVRRRRELASGLRAALTGAGEGFARAARAARPPTAE